MNWLYSFLSVARNPVLQYLLIMSVVFTPLAVAANTVPSMSIVQIEIFTVAHQEGQNETQLQDADLSQSISIHYYELDGIQFVETVLSKNLSASPDQSRRLVLQRIQYLDSKARMRMNQAASGLVRAVNYGIDRYPAIVFDGQAVVYGVTDLPTAIKHYQAWRTENTL